MVFLWLIILPYDLWVTAFRHCFLDHQIPFAGAVQFSIVMNMLFLLDVVIRLITGYVDQATGECVLSPRKIFFKYLKSFWFWVDLYTWYFVLRMVLQREVFISRMYGLIRFIRLSRIVTIWKDLELIIRLVSSGMYIEPVRFLMLAVLLLHFNACMLCYLPVLIDYLYGTRSVSWIKDYQDLYKKGHKDFSCYQSYAHGLMLCLSYFHYGYMFSITTNSVIENVLVIFATFCGYVFKSLLISSIYYYYKLKTNNKYENIKKSTKTWHNICRIQYCWTRKVHSYLQNRFGMDCVLPDITDLPITVQLEICKEIWLNDVENSLRFRYFPLPLLLQISKQFILDIFMPNDVIYKAGQPANFAYFLCSGTIAVYSKEKEVFHIHSRKYFGISAFHVKVLYPTYHHTTIATEPCQVLIFSRHDLVLTSSKFPQILKILRSIRDNHLKYFS